MAERNRSQRNRSQSLGVGLWSLALFLYRPFSAKISECFCVYLRETKDDDLAFWQLAHWRFGNWRIGNFLKKQGRSTKRGVALVFCHDFWSKIPPKWKYWLLILCYNTITPSGFLPWQSPASQIFLRITAKLSAFICGKISPNHWWQSEAQAGLMSHPKKLKAKS